MTKEFNRINYTIDSLKDFLNITGEKLEEEFPKGTRVRLIAMYHTDTRQPVPENTIGTVSHINKYGLIYVNWDNGMTEPVDNLIDRFEIVKENKS